MKYLFLVCLTCYSFACFSQDEQPLFRIISLSGKVTLNGADVSVDQRILASPDAVLEIASPGMDYVGILTREGYVGKLLGGKYAVKDIPGIIYKRKYNRKDSHGDTYLDEVRWVGMIEYDKTLSNRVLLSWLPESKPYRLFVENRFGDRLLDTTVNEIEIDLNLTRFLIEMNQGLVLKVRSGKGAELKESEFRMISAVPPDLKQTVESEIARIPVDHPYRKNLVMAILDLNDLYLDLTRELEANKAMDISAMPEDLQNYDRRIKERLAHPIAHPKSK